MDKDKEETKAPSFDPIEKVTIEEELPSSQVIVSPRQIRNGTLRDYHLGPVEIATGTETADVKWKIKLNGKFYYINLKEI